jgi:pimeloyl-ACP methyl ester carboxylesterase
MANGSKRVSMTPIDGKRRVTMTPIDPKHREPIIPIETSRLIPITPIDTSRRVSMTPIDAKLATFTVAPGGQGYASLISTIPCKDAGVPYHRMVINDATVGSMVVYYYVPRFTGPPPSGSSLPYRVQTQGGVDPHRRVVDPSAHQGVVPSEHRYRQKFLVAIHGSGYPHYKSAHDLITDDVDGFAGDDFPDDNNFIVVAPVFDRHLPSIYALHPNYQYPPGYLSQRPDWVNDDTDEDRAFLYNFLEPLSNAPEEWLPWDAYIGNLPEADNLNHYTHCVNDRNGFRSDVALNYLLDLFYQAFPAADRKVYLFGHSGGGQFAARYMMLYPDRLASAVPSSAGSFLFPRPDKLFPYGWKLNLEEMWTRNYRPTNTEVLKDLSDDPRLWWDLFRRMQTFHKIISVGWQEREDENFLSRYWQGSDTYSTFVNFKIEMERAEMIARQYYGDGWPREARAGTLWLEFDANHGGCHTQTCAWLKQFWLDYPARIPYYFYKLGGWRYVKKLDPDFGTLP